jgi:hypothetical protein
VAARVAYIGVLAVVMASRRRYPAPAWATSLAASLLGPILLADEFIGATVLVVTSYSFVAYGPRLRLAPVAGATIVALVVSPLLSLSASGARSCSENELVFVATTPGKHPLCRSIRESDDRPV